MSVLIGNFKACLVTTIEGLDPGRYQVFVGYKTGAVLAILDSEVPVQLDGSETLDLSKPLSGLGNGCRECVGNAG